MSVASTVAWILGALIALYLVAGVVATVVTYWLDKQTSSPQRMQKSYRCVHAILLAVRRGSRLGRVLDLADGGGEELTMAVVRVLNAIWTWWKPKVGLLTAFSASIFFFGIGVGRVQPEYSITVAELDIEAEGVMAPVADALAYILVQITSVGVDVGSYLMVVPAPIVTNGARLLGAVVVVLTPLLYFRTRVKNLR